MTLFADASVLVAIMAVEPDRAEWLQRIDKAESVVTSPIAIWETVRAVSRMVSQPIAEIQHETMLVLNALDIAICAIGDREALAACAAHARYGKGHHRAKLNMGDCFAYACAETNNAGLLYKGDDFAQTDLA